MSFSEDVLLVDRLPRSIWNVSTSIAPKDDARRCAPSDLFLQRGERLLPSLG